MGDDRIVIKNFMSSFFIFYCYLVDGSDVGQRYIFGYVKIYFFVFFLFYSVIFIKVYSVIGIFKFFYYLFICYVKIVINNEW